MDGNSSRYQTLFSARNNDHARSLQNIGKSSLHNTNRYLPPSQNGNPFAEPSKNDLSLQFFEGTNPTNRASQHSSQEGRPRVDVPKLDISRAPYSDQISRKQPASHPSSQAPLTDARTHLKSQYARDLDNQIREKQQRRVMELEHNRDVDQNMLKERYEHDPFGRQGAGAPILDEYGRIMTHKMKPGFKNWNGYREPTGGQSDSASLPTAIYNNVDLDKIKIKPYNPYVNHDVENETQPDFALKAHLARSQMRATHTPMNSISQETSHQPSPSFIPQPQQPQHPHSVGASPTLGLSVVQNTSSEGSPFLQPPQPQYNAPANLSVSPSPSNPPVQNTYYNPAPQHIILQGTQIPYTVTAQQFSPLPQPQPQYQPTASPGRSMSRFGGSPSATHRNSSPSPDPGNVSVYPQASTVNEGLEKTRRMQTEIELQQELLVQIEEKKRKKEEEIRKKKLQDIMDEERVRRENEEFDRLHSTKYTKLEHRNLNLSMATDREKNRSQSPDKLHSSTTFHSTASPDVLKISTLKGSSKRPRTPVEEVERRMKMEARDQHRIEMEERVIRDLPSQVKVQISESVTDELKRMRTGFLLEQNKISDQLTGLKQSSLLANRERIASQKEIDELKYKLKQQQLREEIRQGELYNALISGKGKSSVIETRTTLNTEAEDAIYAMQVGRRPGGYYSNLRQKRDDDVRREVNSNSQLLTVTKRGKVITADDLNDYGYSSANEGLNYLKYFDETENKKQGILMTEHLGRYNLPDQPDSVNNVLNMPIDSEKLTDDVVQILRRNNDRLVLLDEMEHGESDQIRELLKGKDYLFNDHTKPSAKSWMDDEDEQAIRGRFGDEYL